MNRADEVCAAAREHGAPLGGAECVDELPANREEIEPSGRASPSPFARRLTCVSACPVGRAPRA